ncbi:MAG TPA: MFS transporter [Methylomirabilota bacterium]|jgi:MFS family permease|nr:MFS transporter [Methylomirabilota bacterium]
MRRVFYGWIVVASSAAIVCIGMGCLFALGVFLAPIERAMGWSRGAISSVALLNWMAMGLGSFVWGALSDRIGGRGVALGGGFLLGLGLVLASQAQVLWHFYATFGFLVGFAAGAFYAPLTSTASKWFTARRGLAVALVSSGIGVGILIVAPLARALTSAWDWRVAMLVLGDLAWLVTIPVALLLREPPPSPAAPAAVAAGREYTTGEVLATPQFWAIALTHFACCAAHSGPIFHMVTHATDQGVAAMAAATAFGVSGLSSIAGRVGGGLLADRFGAKPTLIAGLAIQAVMIFAYLFARDVGSFYALALVFGVAYGGVMPLYALVTREYFGEKVMGSAYGAVFLVSTLGMGFGSFAGGAIYDRLGSYAWLFIGSSAIGAMAIVLAFTFRRPTVPALSLAQARPAP